MEIPLRLITFFTKIILENDQLRQDGDQGQRQDLVPGKTGITVHGQLHEQGHGVLAGGADVKQKAIFRKR